MDRIQPGSKVLYEDVKRWHPQHQGIYTKGGIAASIIFSLEGHSPYSDRWVKEGEILDYTGQGRAERGNQRWNRYNLGLKRAMEEGSRVHVFQRLRGEPVEYQYHGRWKVVGFREQVAKVTGQKVFRFVLSAEAEDETLTFISVPILSAEALANDVKEPPARYLAKTNRIIRHTKVSKGLKQLYSFKCQICGEVRKMGDGEPWAEAHHIRPLGHPHDGPDSKGNILVLCPNHHADFDFGAIALDPQNPLRIIHKFDKSLEGKRTLILPGHKLSREYLEYHLTQIFNA